MSFLFKTLLYLVIFLFIYGLVKYLKNRFVDYRENLFLSKRKFEVLEILIPPTIERSPIAMENFFSILHGTLLEPGPIDYFIHGIREYLYIFELVGRNGHVHYYINTPEEYKSLVRSALYSNFPTIEIKEADDWKIEAPIFDPDKKIYHKDSKEYTFKASELILNKEDAYPIKTYIDFGFKDKFIDKEEEEKVSDPLGQLLEALGNTKKDETIIYQLLLMPTSNSWKEDGLKLRDKLLGRESVKKSSETRAITDSFLQEIKAFLNVLIDRFAHLFGAHIGSINEQVKKELEKTKDLFPRALALSKRELEIVYAIEKNISKLGFNTYLRLAYFAPKDIFNSSQYESLSYAFRQFNSLDLNSFKSNPNFYGKSYIRMQDFLRLPYLYYLWWKYKMSFPISKKKLDLLRQYDLYSMLLKKIPGKGKIGHKCFVLNTEELATIYHLPGRGIVAPYIKRIDTKKRRPPMELPRN